jgi:hypothetical protein
MEFRVENVHLVSIQPCHPNTSRARVSLGLELELETNSNSNSVRVSKQGHCGVVSGGWRAIVADGDRFDSSPPPVPNELHTSLLVYEEKVKG